MTSLSNSARFEGYLGKLQELSMIDGATLEVKGVFDVLRIDLKAAELKKKLFQQKKAE